MKTVFPVRQWEERTPRSQGIDPAALDSALLFFSKHAGGCGTDEMVIIRNGYIIWKGPDTNNKHAIFSCTKVFTSTVMGVLVTAGKMSVTDPAVSYYPELVEGNEGQSVYNRLRLIDLATMSGGYSGVIADCWQLHLKGKHDESLECTKKYIIPGAPRFSPASHWSYRDPEVHMLGYILTRTAGKSLQTVFNESIAGMIGMRDPEWSDYGLRDGILFNNPAGTPNDLDSEEMNQSQGGVRTTPLDLARLGLLYLCKGNWNGTQVLDSTFACMAISNQVPVELPAIGLDLAGRYGFYWWTNGVRKDGTRPWPSAPPGAATAHGFGRNFCFVIPEWNMVIVRMSPSNKSSIPAHGDPVWEGFFKRLGMGIF